MNILIANGDAIEATDWRIQLEEKGHMVWDICTELSTMVYLLTQERVDVVFCAANLIKSEPNVVIESSKAFFPRTSFVIVGSLPTSVFKGDLKKIPIKKAFDTNLDRYYKPKASTKRTEVYSTQQASILLTNHFIAQEDAEQIVRQAIPGLAPGFVVIHVTADMDYVRVNHLLKNLTAKLNIPVMFQVYPGNHFLILGGSPSMEQCLNVGSQIRLELLRETEAEFSIGISRMRYRATDLNACRKEAERASAAVTAFGKNSVIHINYLDNNDFEYIYPWYKEKKLVEETIDGDAQGAVQMVDDIFAVLKAHPKCTTNLVSKVVLGIIVKLNIAAASRTAALEKLQGETLSIKRLMQCSTVDAMSNFLKNGISEFAKEMDLLTDVKREALYLNLEHMKKSKDQRLSLDLNLEATLNSTISFINAAVFRNGGTDIYSYFKTVDDEDED